jgi:hypothetical protein
VRANALWKKRGCEQARTSPRLFGVGAAVEELFTPDCSAWCEQADPVSVPAANVLAQSHSVSRLGLDPMRPSTETEYTQYTQASQV